MKNISTNYPEWNDPGSEPDQEKKDNGWDPGEKPPSDFFDWFFHHVYESFKEVDTGVANRMADILKDGIIEGGEVIENDTPDYNVLVKPLTGYFKGARLYISSDNEVNLEDYIPSSDEKWISIYAENDDKDVIFNIVEGSTGTDPEKPDEDDSEGILLADVLLDSGMSEITDDDIDEDRKQKTKNKIVQDNNILYPEMFGAKGDNSTDDTQSFKKLINYAQNNATTENGYILALKPNKKYIVNEELTINLDAIRGIEGNNGYIVTESDITVLHLKGNKDTYGATPNRSPNQELADKEISNFIRNLQIKSNSDTNSVGTGLLLDGTFGLILTQNHIFNLKVGIEVINYNRNIIIDGNHVWNCREYCLYYNEPNAHQNIINNNHMSYAKQVVYFNNGDVHNIQIVGNDFEGGYSQDDNHEHVLFFRADKIYPDSDMYDSTQLSQIEIAGNSIEEHMKGSAIIQLEKHHLDIEEDEEGEPLYDQPRISNVQITGNEITSSYCGIRNIQTTSSLVISGNSIRSIDGFAYEHYGHLEGVNITGNSLSYMNDGTRKFQVFRYIPIDYQEVLDGNSEFDSFHTDNIDSDNVSATRNSIISFTFSSNTMNNLFDNSFIIEPLVKLDDTEEVPRLFEATISNNIWQFAYERDNITDDVTGGAVRIESNVNTGFRFNDNTIRLRDYVLDGLIIKSPDDSYGVMGIYNNMIRGTHSDMDTVMDIPQEGDTGITDSQVIIKDNITDESS